VEVILGSLAIYDPYVKELSALTGPPAPKPGFAKGPPPPNGFEKGPEARPCAPPSGPPEAILG
jgi:hypothetical protein